MAQAGPETTAPVVLLFVQVILLVYPTAFQSRTNTLSFTQQAPVLIYFPKGKGPTAGEATGMGGT